MIGSKLRVLGALLTLALLSACGGSGRQEDSQAAVPQDFTGFVKTLVAQTSDSGEPRPVNDIRLVNREVENASAFDDLL